MNYLDTPQTQKANRKFVRAAMNIPLLEREHEQSLARRWREDGDEKALHELVTPYLRLVISTAGRFRTYGLPIGDLVQEGNIGLMQAAARFDPDRNVRFSTYSTWWIRSSMQEFSTFDDCGQNFSTAAVLGCWMERVGPKSPIP